MNKKIPGFTLIELTIAMLLSAIVIGFAYTVYELVAKSYKDLNTKSSELADLQRLDGVLRRDCSKAEVILANASEIKLISPSDTITYRFNAEMIIRAGAMADTFKVMATEPRMFFEGQEIMAELGLPDSLIDQFSFKLLYRTQEIPYHYYKSYSSENLVNKNPHAVDRY